MRSPIPWRWVGVFLTCPCRAAVHPRDFLGPSPCRTLNLPAKPDLRSAHFRAGNTASTARLPIFNGHRSDVGPIQRPGSRSVERTVTIRSAPACTITSADYAFIARLDYDLLDEARNLPFVRWIGPYHPFYKQSAATLERSDEPAAVRRHRHPDAARRRQRHLAPANPDPGRPSSNPRRKNELAGYLRVSIAAGKLANVAALEDVVWIEPAPRREPLNDVGGGEIMRADAIRQILGLYGEGQIVAVADIGLDTGNLNTLHPDIAGRVLNASCLGRTSSLRLERFARSRDPRHRHVSWQRQVFWAAIPASTSTKARMPASRLKRRSSCNRWATATAGWMDWGSDVGVVIATAYNHGARVHNDSWGSPTGDNINTYGGYTTDSQQMDFALWSYPEMLAVVGAGNSGSDANKDGVVDLDSMYAPANRQERGCRRRQ